MKPSKINVKSKAFGNFPLKSGTRDLKQHELVYFGILSKNAYRNTNESQLLNIAAKQNSSPNSPLFTRNNGIKSYMQSSENKTNDFYYFNDSIEKSNEKETHLKQHISTSIPAKNYQVDQNDLINRFKSIENESEINGSNVSTIERINKFERVIRESLGIDSDKSIDKSSAKVRTRNDMLGYNLKETSVDDINDVDGPGPCPIHNRQVHRSMKKNCGNNYDRTHDYQRDEEALDELTKAAEEIMDVSNGVHEIVDFMFIFIDMYFY